MRTSAVAFVASLLLLLATRAHGIRLERRLHGAINSKEMGDAKSGEASIGYSVNKHCTPDGHCSGKVKNPLTHAETSAAKNQITERNGHTSVAEATSHKAEVASHGSQEEAASVVRGAGAPRQRQTYPDILDIAGMDYSPATRKPPIHN
ncbi:uncharacterized protein LOC133889747 [Phragmites australis]|uniref:uncharacterized protein LOC133889747 n=1 Tax=Phragmites australis TaxID=29695 RepID=UPI002D785434|nr:uncharacterized protein LOC133889747 [Phragmites australis]